MTTEEPDLSFLGDLTFEVSNNGHDDNLDREPEPFVIEEMTIEEPPEPRQKIGDGACVICQEPTFRPPGLTRAGNRKRAPKYCALHMPGAKIPQEFEVRDPESALRKISEELADDIKLLGVLSGPLFPVTGMYVYENADAFTTAIVQLAKGNQRALRILHRAASIAPVYQVGTIVAGTAYSLQVDTKGADPHNGIARRLHVDKAYDAVHGASDQQFMEPQTFQGPPRYSTVG